MSSIPFCRSLGKRLAHVPLLALYLPLRESGNGGPPPPKEARQKMFYRRIRSVASGYLRKNHEFAIYERFEVDCKLVL
jgi:hypothetical protein